MSKLVDKVIALLRSLGSQDSAWDSYRRARSLAPEEDMEQVRN